MNDQMKDRERGTLLPVLLSVLLAFLLPVFLPLSAWGASPNAASAVMGAGEQRVFDGAGLLTAEERGQFEDEIAGMRKTMKMDVVVVTTDEAGGKSAEQYADDFYDEGGFGTRSDYSGVLFLIDMDNREIRISTSGTMIRFLTDDRIDKMLDHAYPHASDGDYPGVVRELLADTATYFRKGIPGGQYHYDMETGKISVYRSIRWYEALMAFAAALFSGGAACLNVKRQYAMKTERGRAAGYNLAYRANAQFAFRDQNDVLVNSFVTQRVILRNTGGPRPGGGGGIGGGSRSSTHTSGGGRTHGGGGRKF